MGFNLAFEFSFCLTGEVYDATFRKLGITVSISRSSFRSV